MANVNLDGKYQECPSFLILSYINIYLWYTKYILVEEVHSISNYTGLHPSLNLQGRPNIWLEHQNKKICFLLCLIKKKYEIS